MRTRTETRYRHVPHTIDGKTEIIPQPYEVPLPPRDWDHIGLTVVTASTALMVLASVAWSTASIGDLLSRAASAAVAYGAAGGFDLLWINCMILEYLARYDPDRARVPRYAGHVALAAAMAAVCTQGYLADSIEVGIVAAVVSALAKAGWTLTLRAHARPLDPSTQAWLIRRQSRLGARFALAAQMRHLERVEQRAGAADWDSEDTPVPPVLDTRAPAQDTTTGDVLTYLARKGLTLDTDTVQDITGTVQDGQDSRSEAIVHVIGRADEPVAKTIRAAMDRGVLGKEELLSLARTVHGPDVLESTVVRTRSRVLKQRAQRSAG